MKEGFDTGMNSRTYGILKDFIKSAWLGTWLNKNEMNFQLSVNVSSTCHF